MPAIAIRPAEKFPEPAFATLQRQVFADIQQVSDALAAVLSAEAAAAIKPESPQQHAPLFRLGAYDGEELVGWSIGHMERGDIFYVAHSGVVAAYRRRGIYAALMNAMHEHALSQGAIAMRSQHSVVNNAVIIAKLRAGYHVSGLSQSARMGALLELTLNFSAERQAMYRQRVLPYATPAA